MKTKNCIVCGSEKFESLYQLRDYRLEDDNNYYYYRKCKSCGLIFQDPVLSFESLSTHYNEKQIYNEKITRRGMRNFLQEYGLKKRAKVVLKYKPAGKLLDIGCGSGNFIRYISDKTEFQVFGNEINKENVNTLKRKYGLDVRIGNINEIDFPDKHFDVITLWDVIEHVENPNQILVEIKRILKPDGILVIRVPNGDSLDSKIFSKYWAGLDAPRHLYIFSISCITKLLENNSFTIKSKRTDIGGYLNFINSISFMFNGIKVNPKLKNAILKVLRSVLFQFLFFPLIWVKNQSLLGTSLTIIVQNSNK